MAQALAWLDRDHADSLRCAQPDWIPAWGRWWPKLFSQDGNGVRTETKVARVERESADGPVTVTTADGASVVADELLVAIGRRPNTGTSGWKP